MVINGPYFWKVPKPEALEPSGGLSSNQNSDVCLNLGLRSQTGMKLQWSYDIWSTVLSQWSEQMTILILILQTDPWWVAMSHLYGFFTSPFSPQASLGGLGGSKQLTGKTSKRFFEGWASGWVTTLQCPVLEFVFQTANGCRSVGYTVTNSALIPFSFQPDTLRHHLILSTFPVCLPLVRHSTSMSNPVCYPRPPWASSDQLWKFTFFISYCKILRKNSHIYQSLRAKLQIV